MGISQMPDVDYPVVTVNVTLENAAPDVMETQVRGVRPAEGQRADSPAADGGAACGERVAA